MSFDLDGYLERLEKSLEREFGADFLYLGLQGSYLRGEATDSSDIDAMVILESLTQRELDRYRKIIEDLGDFERSCGFICSREDIAHWNPLELSQLRLATKDLHGSLADLLPSWTREDEINYVKFSLNNLYHALCHSYLHSPRERFAAKLASHFKSAFFILQFTHYLESGDFIQSKRELADALSGDERVIMSRALSGETDLARDFALLQGWCQRKLASL